MALRNRRLAFSSHLYEHPVGGHAPIRCRSATILPKSSRPTGLLLTGGFAARLLLGRTPYDDLAGFGGLAVRLALTGQVRSRTRAKCWPREQRKTVKPRRSSVSRSKTSKRSARRISVASA